MEGYKLNQRNYQSDYVLTITPCESPAERECRLRIEQADAAFERHKERVLHVVVGIALLAGAILCIWLLAKHGIRSSEGKLVLLALLPQLGFLIGGLLGKLPK